MRILVLFLLLTTYSFAFDSSNSDFLMISDIEDPVSNIEAFLTSFFISSGIKANSSLNCFNAEEATQFFNLLVNTSAFEQAFSTSSTLSEASIFISLYDSFYVSSQGIDCLISSSDFAKLNITASMMGAFHVYLQADPFQFLPIIQPMITALNNNLYSAAGIAANVWFKSFLKLLSSNGEDYLNPLAFFNGVFQGLGLQLPQSIYQCFNESSGVSLNFLVIGMEYAFYNNNTTPSSNILEDFLQSEGYQQLAQMAESIACMNSSVEHEILTAYLGIDPLSDDFIEVVYNTIDTNLGTHAQLSQLTYSVLGPFYSGANQFTWLLKAVKSYVAGIENFENNQNLTGNYENIKTFFNAIWGSFNLKQSDASKCFVSDPQSLWNFITYYYYYCLNQANITQSTTQIYQYLMATQVNGSNNGCLLSSKDVQELAKAAGLNGEYGLLPFTDRMPQLALNFTPIFNLLINKEYQQAGEQYANFFRTIGEIANQEYFIFMSGFYNSIFSNLQLNYPAGYDICYDNQKAQIDFNFFNALAIAGANSNIVSSLTEFWNGEGQTLINAMIKNWNCEAFNNDIQNINSEIGTPITGIFFHQLLQSALESHLNTEHIWYESFTQMKSNFESQEGAAAGIEMYNIVAPIVFLYRDILF